MLLYLYMIFIAVMGCIWQLVINTMMMMMMMTILRLKPVPDPTQPANWMTTALLVLIWPVESDAVITLKTQRQNIAKILSGNAEHAQNFTTDRKLSWVIIISPALWRYIVNMDTTWTYEIPQCQPEWLPSWVSVQGLTSHSARVRVKRLTCLLFRKFRELNKTANWRARTSTAGQNRTKWLQYFELYGLNSPK